MVIESLHGLNATSISMHERFTRSAEVFEQRLFRLNKVGGVEPEDLLEEEAEEEEVEELTQQQMLVQQQRKKIAQMIARRRALALARSLAVARSSSAASIRSLPFSQAASVRALNYAGRLLRPWQRAGHSRPFRGRFRGGRGRGMTRWQFQGRGQWGGSWLWLPRRGPRGGVRGVRPRGGGVRPIRGGVRPRGMAGRGREGIRRKPLPSRQELDTQLDEYMSGSRAALDKQLDEYMASAVDSE